VEYGQKAQLSTQMSPAKIEQRVGDGLEQQRQQDFFVGQNQRVQLMREGENQMEVADRKQLRLTLIQPAGFLQ
jgi:hypothetical protein